MLKGACMFGQSGGPSSVINSSAAGVFIEALEQDYRSLWCCSWYQRYSKRGIL